MTSSRIYGLPPLVCKNPKILILGSLPGQESLNHKEYYYSNSNRIWKVISGITNEMVPETYDQKKELLAKYHIALWDYYESAIRDGSDDKNIRDERPNDIVSFIREHSSITMIAINGFGKYKKFGRTIEQLLQEAQLKGIRVLRLPETSGANTNYGWGVLNNLISEWKHLMETSEKRAMVDPSLANVLYGIMFLNGILKEDYDYRSDSSFNLSDLNEKLSEIESDLNILNKKYLNNEITSNEYDIKAIIDFALERICTATLLYYSDNNVANSALDIQSQPMSSPNDYRVLSEKNYNGFIVAFCFILILLGLIFVSQL